MKNLQFLTLLVSTSILLPLSHPTKYTLLLNLPPLLAAALFLSPAKF